MLLFATAQLIDSHDVHGPLVVDLLMTGAARQHHVVRSVPLTLGQWVEPARRPGASLLADDMSTFAERYLLPRELALQQVALAERAPAASANPYLPPLSVGQVSSSASGPPAARHPRLPTRPLANRHRRVTAPSTRGPDRPSATSPRQVRRRGRAEPERRSTSESCTDQRQCFILEQVDDPTLDLVTANQRAVLPGGRRAVASVA